MKIDNLNVIDFHAHILPGADHGSSSLETTLFQLRCAKEYNVNHVIATPHFYPQSHSVDDFLNLRALAYEKLSPTLDGSLPKVTKGAEVLICDGIERLRGLDKLCVDNTNIILLELPFSVFKTEYCDSVYRLIKDGYDVILAHVDRYPKEHIEMLLDVGAKCQINAAALSGLIVPRHIKEWIKYGRVVALGSDIHNADKNAYKRFDKAKSRILKYGYSEIFEDFSRFIENEATKKQGV